MNTCPRYFKSMFIVIIKLFITMIMYFMQIMHWYRHSHAIPSHEKSLVRHAR